MNHLPAPTIDENGDIPMDADLSLIAAYLAFELTIVEHDAVEHRLATDAAFRERVQALIDSWYLPVSFDDGSVARLLPHEAPRPLVSTAEIEAGWARHVKDHTTPASARVLQFTKRVLRQIPPRVYQSIAATVLIGIIPLLEITELANSFSGLDYSPREYVMERFRGAFNRSVKPDGHAARRIDLGGGSSVLLDTSSTLRYRTMDSVGTRPRGEILRLQGDATIDVSEQTGIT